MSITKMDEAVELTLNSLKYNRFRAQYARTAWEARQIVLELIPPKAVIGAGDSATLKQIGVLEELEARGNKLLNPMTKELTLNTRRRKFRERLLRRSLRTDVYLSGSNAITQDGKLVNIDRVGNRVCGMVIGAPKVIVVAGRNKIVPNVDEALRRIKDVLAPAHTSWKKRNTPCAVTGECNECNSQDRICRVTVILEKRPHLTDMTIVLVDEDLGLGWDPTWPQSRIEAIRAKYQEVTWAFPAGPEAGA